MTETGTELMAVAGPSNDPRYSSDSQAGTSREIPRVRCFACKDWVTYNPKTQHYCRRSPIFLSDSRSNSPKE